ncbi:MAG: hypothetical protein IJQ95_03770 [Paludibacteraceae bacterium]|nr:hypothetical protein [Paludibacteraceae bacterium]
MSELKIFTIIFLVYAVIMLVMVIVQAIQNAKLKQQLTDMRIREQLYNKDSSAQQSVLLDQIKQQADRPRAIDHLLHSNEAKIKSLKERYPSLTDADMQVLVLLGLGIETQDVLQFLDMSKRTYYKRRQLISKRMDISTSELDTKAKLIFTPKY